MDARKILGVGNNASLEEIQRAYREKVRKHHPDMGGDAWAFQQVQEAFEELVNPTSSQSNSTKTNPNSDQQRPPAQPPNSQPTGPQPNYRSGSSSTQYRQSKPDRAKSRKKPSSNAKAPKDKSDARFENRKWWQIFVGELPLQSSTFVFIIMNCCDIFFTHRLMSMGAIEANPFANYVFRQWGFNGMIAFKLFIVAFVCVIAQIIAMKRVKTARALLIVGSILVGMVVLYSYWLFRTRF